MDKNQLEDAKTKCGPNPSQACIFDYLATGDIALAESSGTEEVSAQSDKIIVGRLVTSTKCVFSVIILIHK